MNTMSASATSLLIDYTTVRSANSNRSLRHIETIATLDSVSLRESFRSSRRGLSIDSRGGMLLESRIFDCRSSSTVPDDRCPADVKVGEVQKIRNALKEYALFPKGWDGEDADCPNQISIDRAFRLVELAALARFYPSKVSPSVVGGIGVSFRDKPRKRRVYIEFTNRGSVVAIFDRQNDLQSASFNPNDLQSMSSQLMKRLRAFLTEV